MPAGDAHPDGGVRPGPAVGGEAGEGLPVTQWIDALSGGVRVGPEGDRADEAGEGHVAHGPMAMAVRSVTSRAPSSGVVRWYAVTAPMRPTASGRVTEGRSIAYFRCSQLFLRRMR